jgi:hypothetical protein
MKMGKLGELGKLGKLGEILAVQLFLASGFCLLLYYASQRFSLHSADPDEQH